MTAAVEGGRGVRGREERERTIGESERKEEKGAEQERIGAGRENRQERTRCRTQFPHASARQFAYRNRPNSFLYYLRLADEKGLIAA